jgi:hypothetical protein
MKEGLVRRGKALTSSSSLTLHSIVTLFPSRVLDYNDESTDDCCLHGESQTSPSRESLRIRRRTFPCIEVRTTSSKFSRFEDDVYSDVSIISLCLRTHSDALQNCEYLKP